MQRLMLKLLLTHRLLALKTTPGFTGSVKTEGQSSVCISQRVEILYSQMTNNAHNSRMIFFQFSEISYHVRSAFLGNY